MWKNWYCQASICMPICPWRWSSRGLHCTHPFLVLLHAKAEYHLHYRKLNIIWFSWETKTKKELFSLIIVHFMLPAWLYDLCLIELAFCVMLRKLFLPLGYIRSFLFFLMVFLCLMFTLKYLIYEELTSNPKHEVATLANCSQRCLLNNSYSYHEFKIMFLMYCYYILLHMFFP